MVYFAKPKGDGEVTIQVRIPGMPKFSVEVSPK
jgi:hypothetical protein